MLLFTPRARTLSDEEPIGIDVWVSWLCQICQVGVEAVCLPTDPTVKCPQCGTEIKRYAD